MNKKVRVCWIWSRQQEKAEGKRNGGRQMEEISKRWEHIGSACFCGIEGDVDGK